MASRGRVKGQLKPQRNRVEIGTPGSYLWAPFGEHMKAGLVSLVPIVVLNLFGSAGFIDGNPTVGDRIYTAFTSTLQLMVTFGWVLIAVAAGYCAVWAWMSQGLVRLFRLRPSFYTHLAAHAVAGAIVVFFLSIALLAWNGYADGAGVPVWQLDEFPPLAWGAPAIGAVGAAAGMWALRSHLGWYVTKEREPLKDVFTFVPGHASRDEFERL